MNLDSPSAHTINKLIFWTGSDAEEQREESSDFDLQEDCEDTKPELVGGYEPGRKPDSIYVKVFEDMVAKVIDVEGHLLSAPEWDACEKFANLSYNARYLLVRLCLRKQDKWHRLSALKGYEKELGSDGQVTSAINELSERVPTPEDEVPAKFEDEREIIDLTLDDDEEEVQSAQPEAGPSNVDDESAKATDEEPALSPFAEDESKMDLHELLQCLTVDELKALAKQTKIRAIQNRPSLIAAILSSTSTQCTLGFSPLKQGHHCQSKAFSRPRLSFSNLKGSKRPIRTQADAVRDIILSILVKCIRINVYLFNLIRRIHLIYLRCTESTPQILTAALLSAFKKRRYVSYEYNRTSDIWRSREALLEYEEALELQAQIGELLENTSKSPANFAHSTFGMPSTPVAGLTGSAHLASTTPTPMSTKTTRESSAVLLNNADGEPELLTETVRLHNARCVTQIVLASAYPKWKAMVERKKEELLVKKEQGTPGDQRRSALERFECGHIYTRIMQKCVAALGILKEYGRELELLEELIAQRLWRRGSRGQWYERKALILMTHLPKNSDVEDEEVIEKERKNALFRRALECVREGLEDRDTHIVYRPMLVRRLRRLENKLRLSPEERHSCEGELKKSEEVLEVGVRVWNKVGRLGLDPFGQVLTPLKSGADFNRPVTPMTSTGVDLKAWGALTPMSVKSVSAASMSEKRRKGNHKQVDIDNDNGWRWKGKSIWKGNDGKDVHVEILALQRYEAKGYKGFHSEGSIVRTIFGLLFSDIIFTPMPGAFETPYQSAPLDIAEDSFYHARRDLIEARLRDIEDGKACEILERADQEHREKHSYIVGVQWDLFSRQDLLDIVTCIQGNSLAVICRVLCEDYAKRGGGVPDLIVWHLKDKICKFVEVKGPGDSLRETQKVWIDVMLGAGLPVEVCRVVEVGKVKVKPKKADSETVNSKKSSSKKGKQKAIQDFESDVEEMLFDPKADDEEWVEAMKVDNSLAETPLKGKRRRDVKSPITPSSPSRPDRTINRVEVLVPLSPYKRAQLETRQSSVQ